MELRDLRTFSAVVELGSFTRAAGRLHLVQSAVSQAVGRLERQLGLRLLERRPGPVGLTPAGAALWRHAQLALNSIRRAEDDMAAYRGLSKGSVHLGVLPTIIPFLLTPLLRQLRESHPGLELHVHDGLSSEVLESLRLGQLDLVMVFLPIEAPDLAVEQLLQKPLAVAVGRGHPLWRRREVSMAELSEESWVAFTGGNPGRRWLDEAFAVAGCRARVSIEVATLAEMKAFVEAGYGLCLMPPESFAGECKTGALHTLSLKAPTPLYTLGYAWDPQHPSGAVLLVRDVLLTVVTDRANARVPIGSKPAI